MLVFPQKNNVVLAEGLEPTCDQLPFLQGISLRGYARQVSGRYESYRSHGFRKESFGKYQRQRRIPDEHELIKNKSLLLNDAGCTFLLRYGLFFIILQLIYQCINLLICP